MSVDDDLGQLIAKLTMRPRSNFPNEYDQLIITTLQMLADTRRQVVEWARRVERLEGFAQVDAFVARASVARASDAIDDGVQAAAAAVAKKDRDELARVLTKLNEATRLCEAQNAHIGRLQNQLANVPGWEPACLDARSKLSASEAVRETLSNQLEATQAQLDKFTSGCADQTIQIMELRGEIARMRESHAGELYRAEARAEECRIAGKQLDDELRAAWEVLAEASLEGIPYWSSRGDESLAEAMRKREDAWMVKVATAQEERDASRKDLKDIGAAHWRAVAEWEAVNRTQAVGLPPTRADIVRFLLAERETLREQLMVADGDRVPLRMDLDCAEGKLRRLAPVVKALQEWLPVGKLTSKTSGMYLVDAHLIEAAETWERAEADALDDEDATGGGFAAAAANEGARIAAESDDGPIPGPV